MTVTKIVVSKGKSVEMDDQSWMKVNYELTAEGEYKNGKDLNRAKEIMTKIIDGWIFDKTEKTLSPTVGAKEKSVWTNYDKRPCEEGEEGWAFIDKIPKELMIQLTWQWKQIGDMEYRLGGNGKIVNRRPIK